MSQQSVTLTVTPAELALLVDGLAMTLLKLDAQKRTIRRQGGRASGPGDASAEVMVLYRRLKALQA